MKEFTLKNDETLWVRQARGTDAAACLAYLRCVGGESDYLLVGPEGVPLTEAQEAEFLEAQFDKPDRRMFVALIGDEVVGLANVEAKTHKRIAHNAHMGISVRRRLWGQGVGSVLMQEIIDFCRETGTIRNLCLEVYADNERAVRLYQKFGFAVDGLRKKYLLVNGVYHDEALMRLSL